MQGISPIHRRRHRGRRRGNRHINPRRRGGFRRRNPFGLDNQLVGLAGGAIVAGIGCRVIPDMSFLASYNTGWTGYALDAGVGWVISRFGLRHINHNWEVGGYVGTILSVASRIISEKFGSSIFGNGTDSMSYYMDSPFPYRGDASMGPYPMYPGGRYLGPAAVPTAATAVQAGQAASAAVQAAAATPSAASAPATAPGGGGGWRGSSRWH
jgi:hypothetical protein